MTLYTRQHRGQHYSIFSLLLLNSVVLCVVLCEVSLSNFVILSTRDNRSNTVDTSCMKSSISYRSSVCVCGRSSSVGVLYRSSRLCWSRDILDSSIGVASISYWGSGVAHGGDNRLHVNIGLSSDILMDIRLSSNFLMNIWLSRNFFMNIRNSSNLSCLYRLFMNIRLCSNLLMDIRKSNWGLLWGWSRQCCRYKGQQDKELHIGED